MNPLHCLPLLLLLASISGCSSVSVQSDYDPKTDFSQYRSYAWMPRPAYESGDPRIDNAIVEGRIISAVESALAARGFQKADPASADFLVGYTAAINRELGAHVIDRYYAYPTPYYYGGFYRYPWGPPPSRPEVVYYEYDQGTLVLDLADAASKGLIFRGSAQARLLENPSPEQSAQRINEAVTKILAELPPTS